LLLLDEPFSAVDAPLRARLRREFLQLQQEFDTTTILVTHDPAEAILLADEFLLLDAGRVLQTGSVGEVFLRPANEAVARLLGAEIIGRGRAVAPDCIVAGPPLVPLKRIGWSVRPERIRFAEDAPYPVRILNIGEVRDGQRSITVQLGDALFDTSADPGFRVADGSCRVAIDPQAVQISISTPRSSRSTGIRKVRR
jgi:ABC-type sulfate/molybdate transport systems ATPase subunit